MNKLGDTAKRVRNLLDICESETPHTLRFDHDITVTPQDGDIIYCNTAQKN